MFSRHTALNHDKEEYQHENSAEIKESSDARDSQHIMVKKTRLCKVVGFHNRFALIVIADQRVLA